MASNGDFNERIRPGEAQRESEERYRRLYNETPVMLHSINHDGRLVSVSNYWLDIMGYERSEVIGRKTTEFLTDASRRYAEEIVLPEFFRTGHCQDVPYQLVKKNGQIIDVLLSAIAERDSAGKITRTLAVMIDVTKRKRAEEALRESEEKFSKAFQATPTMLVITSLAEGEFMEANEAFEYISGYRREEVIGRTSLEINFWKDPDDRDRMIRMLSENGKVRNQEIDFVDKSGRVFVGLYSAEIIEIKGEQCLLSLVNDTTARKRMAEEIEVLNTDLAARAFELETANRELEAFNYTVSHDLRKPLSNINIYCQIVQELCAAGLDEQCRNYVREIYEGTLRMNRLIDTLLDFSRLSRCEIIQETVNLSELAKDIAAEFRLTEPQRRAIFTIAEGVEAYGDARLLRVVLENLIGNAWKYTGKQEETRIEFGMMEVGGKRCYFVRDNGPGFDMAHADRLFAAFQRLPGTEEFVGHGIGLATVQRIIERHGGRVWATGEVGTGAMFYFTL